MKLFYTPDTNTINEDVHHQLLDEEGRWMKRNGKDGYLDDNGQFHVCNPEDLNDKEKFLQALAHNRVAKFAYRYGIGSDFRYDPKFTSQEKARKMRADFIGTPSKYSYYNKIWIDDIADKPVMAKIRVSGHPFVYGAWAAQSRDCDCVLNILLPDENGKIYDENKHFWNDYRFNHQIIALTMKYDMFHPSKEAEAWMENLMRSINRNEQPHVSLAEIKAKIDPTAKIEKSPMYDLRKFNYEKSENPVIPRGRVPWKHEEIATKNAQRQINMANNPMNAVVRTSEVNKFFDHEHIIKIQDKDTGEVTEYILVPVGKFNYLVDVYNNKAYYFKKDNVNNVNTANKRKGLEVKVEVDEALRTNLGRNLIKLTEFQIRDLVRKSIVRLLR